MEKILKILSELVPDVDFTAEKNLVDDGLIDSFDIISIIADLNTEYKISIPPQEIDADNFNSAAKIKAMVDRILTQSQ